MEKHQLIRANCRGSEVIVVDRQGDGSVTIFDGRAYGYANLRNVELLDGAKVVDIPMRVYDGIYYHYELVDDNGHRTLLDPASLNSEHYGEGR